MWKDIRIDNIDTIRKCVAEFEVWANRILPYGKMKVKIYEDQTGLFIGYTDVRIVRKFDNEPEGSVGHGGTMEEALEETIRNFLKILKEDYTAELATSGLKEMDIEYSEYSDF